MRLGFAGRVLQRHLRRGGSVVQRLAVELDGVFGDDRRLIHFAADRGSGACDTAAASSAGGRSRCGGLGRSTSLRVGKGRER